MSQPDIMSADEVEYLRSRGADNDLDFPVAGENVVALAKSHEQLRADLAAARSLLREAQEDSERLDWLEKNIGASFIGKISWRYGDQGYWQGHVREVIDAASAALPSSPTPATDGEQ